MQCSPGEPDRLNGQADPKSSDPACKIARESGHKALLLKSIVERAESSGDSLLAGLSSAQRETAILTPWVASTESTRIAAHYEPVVLLGAAISPSMVPDETTKRLGLPVMEDDYGATCDHGGAVAPEVIDAMVPGRFADYVKDGAPRDVATRLSQNYCGADKAAVERKDIDIVNGQDVCKNQVPALSDLKDDIVGPGSVAGTPAGCIKPEPIDSAKLQETIDKEKIPRVEPEHDLQKDDDPDDKTGKRLATGAVNGNDFFQVYAVMRADVSRLHRGDPGVRIGAGLKTGALPPDPFEKHGIAQAEFFYDQTTDALEEDRCWRKGGACGLTFPEYEANVLWNMRWRARLRLYRVPENPPPNANILVDGVPDAPFEARAYLPEVLGTVNEDIQDGVPYRILENRINPGDSLSTK